MKKRLLVLVAALTLLGVGPVMADHGDYVADPPGSPEHCQEVGDDSAGENDDFGLGTAEDTVVSAIEEADPDDDRDCDNSGGRRP